MEIPFSDCKYNPLGLSILEQDNFIIPTSQGLLPLDILSAGTCTQTKSIIFNNDFILYNPYLTITLILQGKWKFPISIGRFRRILDNERSMYKRSQALAIKANRSRMTIIKLINFASTMFPQ